MILTRSPRSLASPQFFARLRAPAGEAGPPRAPFFASPLGEASERSERVKGLQKPFTRPL